MNSFIVNKIEYIVDKTWESNYFVGIRIVNNKYHVSFPIGYDLKSNMPEEYYKNALIDLYKTINPAKNECFENENGSKNIEIPMYSYLWILSDYYSNGLYKYNEKLYKIGSNGKINWKRTYRNKFYIKDNTPYYLDTVIEINKREENIITELQKYCINISVDMLVFLGSFKKVRCNIDDNTIKNNKNYYINILEKEYRKTNNDKKQMLLLNIKNIINDSSSDNINIRYFGTFNYEYVWENMVRKLFGNVKDMREFFPFANWFIKPKYEKTKSSNLIEDTIYVDNEAKRIYIIDSKYYTYGDSKDVKRLPATSSIHKQVVYAEHVSNMEKYKGYEVYNIFVIPSNTNEFIEYEGYAKMEYAEKNKPYETIHLCLLNINKVINKYLKYEKADIEELISIIQKEDK